MKKIFIIFLFSIFFIPTTLWNNKEGRFFVSDLTIKELSKNIEKLKEQKADFIEKNKELSKEYGELISFLRNDISKEEIQDIRNVVEDFIRKRDTLEKKLKEQINKLEDTTQTKKDIIFHRADFYKYIAKFVEKEKRDHFISHIKFQVQSEKESKDLIEEILVHQNILDQRVTYIKGKIETHKENLHTQIEWKILTKIKERIDEIDTNKKYDQISKETKNNIYTSFILNIEERIKELETTNLSENFKQIRKLILSKMKDEIQSKIK